MILVIQTDVGEFHPSEKIADALGLARPTHGKYTFGRFDKRTRTGRVGNRYIAKVRAHCFARWAAGEDGPFMRGGRDDG